jgi:hypothetical protein
MLCLGLLWLRDESFLQANPRFSAMFATSLLLRPAPEVKIKALVHHETCSKNGWIIFCRRLRLWRTAYSLAPAEFSY